MRGAAVAGGAAKPTLGLLEWFRPGEHERAEAAIEAAHRLGIRHLRTGVSWAEYCAEGGEAWYDWLLPRLGRELDLLPCFTYTPPSLGVAPSSAAPPRDPKAYADFLDVMLTRYGGHFSHVELWNEPNNLNDWDWRLDPDWRIFADMMVMAGHWVRRRGWRTVLGGMCPFDPNWLAGMAERRVLHEMDVIGLHGFPGTWDSPRTGWPGWVGLVDQTRAVLDHYCLKPEIWITECGYSTWRHDEARQIDAFLEVLEAPVGRVYWYGLQDLHPAESSQDGFHFDERHYHLGVFDASHRPKLLARGLEAGGADALRGLQSVWAGAPRLVKPDHHPVVITGGAGFLGANLADRLAGEGRTVLLVDGLKRPGVEKNLEWLLARHGERIQLEVADIRDPYLWRDRLAGAEAVFHFAAQVAVTSSLDHPREDFDTNASGTLNLLEALRSLPAPPPLFFASTNKVYGDLADIEFSRKGEQWMPTDPQLGARGIDETRPLDLHSPYGCSKGAADQYVLDYARMFGLPATVLRMSCLYGPRQFGTEDQGWVAHFLISALRGAPVSIYGDGRQVRDVLHVEDAVEAYLAAWREIHAVSGRAFNLGGGPENAVSLHQVLGAIERLTGRSMALSYAPTRPGDQVWYVSDTSRFADATGWQPRRPWIDGLAHLHEWAAEFFGAAPRTEHETEGRLSACASP